MITVDKTWNDANDQDGIRPESITINLLADGEVVDRATIEPDEDGVWTHSFFELPKYKAGQEIVYTVEEEAVDGYETSVDGYDVTNTHVPETMDVKGIKTWDDAEDQDGVRPESITVNLLADGEVVDSIEVKPDEDGEWAYAFTDLPKFKAGQEIVCTVEEEAVDGYETTVDGYDITNTHVPETVDVEGIKTWDDADDQDGLRPKSVTIFLLADGEVVDSVEVKPDEDGMWTYAFTDLPKFKAGKEIVYTVEEEAMDGYETSVDGYDITNTHVPETVDVEGIKTWDDADDQDGIRPKSITIDLLADGVKADSLTVTAKNDWKWRFTGLPKYQDGVMIEYTVEEESVEGYTAEISGTAEEGFVIVNQHVPVPKPDPDPDPYQYHFTFTKQWQGEPADSIVWTLYDAKGNVVHKKFNKKTVSATEWHYEAWFQSDVSGYYLVEEAVDGYKTRYENTGSYADETDRCYNGGTIVNYQVPQTGDDARLTLWLVMALLGAGLLGGGVYFLLRRGRR